MPGFIGGSGSAMASQICEGYILLNKNTLRGWASADLQTLRHELDKLLREVRGISGVLRVDRRMTGGGKMAEAN